MTFERKIVVGIDDIMAVTFECSKCKARTTVLAESVKDIPIACGSCQASWQIRGIKNLVSSEFQAPDALIRSLAIMRILEVNAPFKILFEFQEPMENK
jgi:hypothetical protein